MAKQAKKKKSKVIIIGGGIGGLASACLLAKKGYAVTVYEKEDRVGGRMNLLEADGFTFDMGPSWYLMPDVFQHFFTLLGEKIEKHLDLIKLDPSYTVFFKDTPLKTTISTDKKKLQALFEELEPHAGAKILPYLKTAEAQYNIALQDFLYRNYDRLSDFFNKTVIRKALSFSLFTSMQKFVSKYFKSDALKKIMQYQLVFLGSSPYNTPALYKIMSHVDFNQGVFYPQGGLYKIIEALVRIGAKHHVHYVTNSPITKIIIEKGKAAGVQLQSGQIEHADIVIANSDLQHTETILITEPHYRSYPPAYWKSRVMAPSGLILYLGVNGTLPELTHHNLVFAKNWQEHFSDIFDTPRFPADPSLYICNPNKTDPSVAPAGKENLFVFVPIAAGLAYDQAKLNKYTQHILIILEKSLGISDLRQRITYMKTFCIKDFEQKYNSYKGTALGLAHTLWQTAIFRPKNYNKKVKNLFYVGANTNPGIGVPMCLISAELAYKRIIKNQSHRALKKL